MFSAFDTRKDPTGFFYYYYFGLGRNVNNERWMEPGGKHKHRFTRPKSQTSRRHFVSKSNPVSGVAENVFFGAFKFNIIFNKIKLDRFAVLLIYLQLAINPFHISNY